MIKTLGAAALALTVMAGVGTAQAQQFMPPESVQQDCNCGPAWNPPPRPVYRDRCTVVTPATIPIAQDVYPYPNMSYAFRAACSSGAMVVGNLAFWHDTVLAY